MLKYWRDCFWWSLAWAIVVGATIVTVGVRADATQLVPVDPLLTYMQAAGFPAWAAVVAWGVLRITSEIRAIATRFDSFMLQTERRLARIEAIVNMGGGHHLISTPKDYCPEGHL